MQAEFIRALETRTREAQIQLGNNTLRFVPGGSTLVVSFHPAKGGKHLSSASFQIWGESFLKKRGCSLLGVDSQSDDWYRSPDLHALLRQIAEKGFFSAYSRTIFYGGSMGGFAALVFSELAPGCIVLAHNPQSTLIPEATPWETRFNIGKKQNWNGDFNDGATSAKHAEVVYVTYDPYCEEDRIHVDRLQNKCNLVRLPVPHVGHQMPVWLQQMGILDKVFDAAAAGTLSRAVFKPWAKARTNLPNYCMNLAERCRTPRKKVQLLEMARIRGPKLEQPRNLLWSLTQSGTIQHQTEQFRPVAIWCMNAQQITNGQKLLDTLRPNDAVCPALFMPPNRPHDLAEAFGQQSQHTVVKDEMTRLLWSRPNLIHMIRPSTSGFDQLLVTELAERGYLQILLEEDPNDPAPWVRMDSIADLAAMASTLTAIQAQLESQPARWRVVPAVEWKNSHPSNALLAAWLTSIANPVSTKAESSPTDQFSHKTTTISVAPKKHHLEMTENLKGPLPNFECSGKKFSVHTMIPIIDAGNVIDHFRLTQGSHTPGRATIPRTVIQFWDKAPPDQVQILLNRNIELCKKYGITYLLFNDQSARLSMVEHHASAGVIKAFDSAPHPAMRCDVFRLWYLAKFGGYYVDADLVMTEKFHEIYDDAGEVVLFQWDNGKLNTVCNWLIGSAPNSSLMAFALEATWRSVLVALAKDPEQAMRSILSVSGPGRFTRAFGDLIVHFNQATPEGRLPITLRPISYAYTIVKNGPQYLHTPLEYKNTGLHWTHHAKK